MIAQRTNLASGSSKDHTATPSSHQNILGDTAKSLGWSSSQMRRKHFRRRKSKSTKTSNIQGALHITGIVGCALHYHISPNRIASPVIVMDALICTPDSGYIGSSGSLKGEIAEPASQRLGYAASKSSSFLFHCPTKMWHKLMHAYVGNLVTLQLDILIPSKQQVPHLNPVSPILPVASQTSSGKLSSLNLHPDLSNKLDFLHSQLKLSRNILLQYRTLQEDHL